MSKDKSLYTRPPRKSYAELQEELDRTAKKLGQTKSMVYRLLREVEDLNLVIKSRQERNKPEI